MPPSSKPSAFDGDSDRPKRHAQARSADRQRERERPGLMGLKGLTKTRVHPGFPPPAPPGAAKPAPEPEELCEIDRTILRHLQANGRMPNVALAQLLQLTPSSVHKRIRRLQEKSFILGFEALLNAGKLQSGLLAYVQVQMENADEHARDNFRAAMQTCNGVMECHTIANGYDYLLKLRVADVAACTRLLAAAVWPLRGVRSTRTFMVMEEVKHTGRIGI
jgi:Lrp/AsnC family leucine-responsive transcriptional regulator